MLSPNQVMNNGFPVNQPDNANLYPPLPQSLILEETKEWNYAMRRSMQEIIPGLYLGPYSAAGRAKLQELQETGVTHIVCIRQDIEAQFVRPLFPEIFKYMVLNIADTLTENIIQHFQPVKAFIDDALNNGGKVLVHGNAGISRCAALVIAYIMEKYGLTHSDAFLLVQGKRFCINPSDGFMAQLKEYEPIYRARKAQEHNQLGEHNQRTKRSLHEMEHDRNDEKTNIMT